MGRPFYDITGIRFGRLMAVKSTNEDHNKFWEFQCDCGTLKRIRSSHVLSGAVISCGCRMRETGKVSNLIHGKSSSRTYIAWASMCGRCLNPNNQAYKYYGGRGIYVCEEWKQFVNFYRDMGSVPDGYSLDRINNDGPYSKENCRWATDYQQAQNKSNNRIFSISGETKTMSQWAREYKIDVRKVHARLKAGWSIEASLGKKV